MTAPTITYTWDDGESAYVTTDGGGAHDRLTYAANEWTWTDGDSQFTESYEVIAGGSAGEWRITEHIDVDGSTLSFTYDANARLDKVTTADGDYTQYGYDAAGNITQITTSYTDLDNGNNSEQLIRTYYEYDASNRLIKVTTDLSPNDEATTDGNIYVTNYTYDGTSNRIASISQTDGSKLDIIYDAQGRVTSLTQTVAGSETRVTTISYDSVNGITTLTDAGGNDIHLYYDAQGRLLQIITPPANPGQDARMVQFKYDVDGNLESSIESEVAVGAPAVTYASTGRGSNELGTDAWSTDLSTPPLQGTGLPNWAGYNLNETQWEATDGPYNPSTTNPPADSVVSLALGNNAGTTSTGGGTTTASFGVTKTQSYEFVWYFKRDDTADHDLQFTPDYTGALTINNASSTATASPHNKFATITAAQLQGLAKDKWYKLVGYVRAHDYSVIVPDGEQGGVYDLTDGSKVSGINVRSLRWADNVASEQSGSRFFASNSTGSDTYRTHIYKPEVREMQIESFILSDLAQTGDSTLDVTTDAALFHNPGGTSGGIPTSVAYATNGRETLYEYDANGNVTKITDPQGNVTERTYDASNNLLTEKVTGAVNGLAAQSLVTRYVYDAENHLQFEIDAEGHVREYIYDADGQLQRILAFPDSPYVHPVTPPLTDSQAPSLANIASWKASVSDLRQISIIKNQYDARGNLVQTTKFGDPIDGQGASVGGTSGVTYASTGRSEISDVDATGWESDVNNVPAGAPSLSGWSGYNFAETDWEATTGPYSPTTGPDTVVSLRLGNTNPGAASAGGGATTNSFIVNGSKSYEFTFYFKREGPADHDLQFTPDYLGAQTINNATNGNATSYNKFATITETQLAGLTEGKWYKLVAYVLANGETAVVPDDTHGGVYELDGPSAGEKVDGINVRSLRWADAAANQQSGSRFFAINATTDTHYTHIYRPEVREITSQAAILSDDAQTGDSTLDIATDQALFDNPGGTNATGDEQRATYYSYDQSGQLLERRLAGQGNSETFTYDGMGRVVTSTDFGNATTSIVFNDNVDANGLTTTVITLATGLTRTSTYNKAGELINEFLTASGAADNPVSYNYDDRGLLRMVTDTQGNKSHILYDDVGRKTADISADGSLAEYIYDVSGRLVATTQFHTKLDPAVLVDVNGDPVDVDLSSIRPGTHSEDQWNWTVYDEAGRIVQAIDGSGGVAEFTYDNASRLIKTVGYVEALTSTQLDGLKATLPVAPQSLDEDAAVDSISRNFYDADGRLVAALDGEGYLSENIYDEAGSILETITYAGRTDQLDRATGTLTELKDGRSSTTTEDLRSYYISDNQGVLKYVANHAGQLSEYFYDATGNQIQTKVYAVALPPTNDYSLNNIDALADSSNSISSWSVYNDAGRLSHSIDAEGQVAAFFYDGSGRLTKTVAYASKRVTTSSPSHADMTSWTTGENANAENRVSYNIYNEKSELQYTVDGEGYVAENSYDSEGQLTSTKRYDNAVTTASWTVAPQASDVTGQPLGNSSETIFAYDVNGRLQRSTDAGGIHTDFTYTGIGQILRQTTAAGLPEERIIEFAYDGAGRVITETRNPGHSTDEIAVSYAYDGFGNQVSGTDANGNITTYEYDLLGRLTKEIWPATSGASLDVETSYDGLGQIISQTAANGSITTFSYDNLGRLIGETRPEGVDVTYVYNNFGDLVQATDARQASSTNYLDKLGRITLSVDAEGNAAATSYNSFGQVETVTRYANAFSGTLVIGTPPTIGAGTGFDIEVDPANDAVTSFGYDELGRLISQTQSISDTTDAVTHFEYDAQGNLVKNTDANTDSGYNYYDDQGRLTLSIDAEGYATATSYTSFGEVDSVIRYANASSAIAATGAPPTIGSGSGFDIEMDSAKDQVTQYSYDDLGRLIDENRPDNAGNTYAYDANGNLTTITDAAGNKSYNYYDALNRLTLSVDAEGYVTKSGYDSFGNLATVTRFENAASITGVDADIPPDISALADTAKDQVSIFTYDGLGRVTTESSSVDGNINNNISTSYVYDTVGNLVKITDPNGNETYNYYDDLGRATLSIDAEGYATATGYTAFGEIASVTRYETPVDLSGINTATPPTVTLDSANDATTIFDYDQRGLVTTSTDAEGYFETFTYDAAGNRVSSVGKSSTLIAGQDKATTNYIYNERGLLISETIPAETYDGAGSLVASSITNAFEYDASGNRTRLIEAQGRPEERITDYVFDKNNRLIETRGEARTVLDQSDHTTETTGFIPSDKVDYDVRGNIIRTEDATGAETFFYYDSANRKTAQINALGTYTAYTYDANNNILTTKVFGDTVALPPAPGGTPPLAPTGGNHRETSFSYDALDRLIESRVIGVTTGEWNGTSYTTQSGDLVTAYQYDAGGNVIELTDPDANSIHSYYDALGRKEAQFDQEGFLTTWAYDSDGNVITESRYATLADPATITAATDWQQITGTIADSNSDRITGYSYDTVGNRLTETRQNVEVYDGSGGNLAAAPATVSYAYNGLGQVVSKSEATGDTASYLYDTTGRLTSEQKQAFTNYLGATGITPTVDYRYDGLGNLMRTEQAGSANAAARATSYNYGAGGLLASVTDATGQTRSYAYDKAGRAIRDQYTRTESDGTTTHTEAVLSSFDVLGRTSEQTLATLNAALWNKGDYSTTAYNAYGDVASLTINGSSFAQENKYDAAGRLWATNSGDGVWKYFGYDKNGNQSVAITSAGADLTGLADTAAALALAGQADVNASYTVYNARNLATQVTEEGRELDSANVQDITSSRSYNGFGEVASETNALGHTTDYDYNNIGRQIKVEAPSVSVTAENGAVTNERPTQYAYYDAAGRLVASKDANGNLTELTLLAGSGYGGSEALVTQTTFADNSFVTSGFDVHGDARKITDQIGRITTQDFDQAGRVTQVTKPGGLVTHYAYDSAGQRISEWNDVLGAANKQTTDYDSQGRVISQIAFGGDETTTSYSWDGTISTALDGGGTLGTFGGWTKITSYEADRSSASDAITALTQSTDLFGRVTDKIDMGGQDYDYGYDAAGRVISETSSTGKNASFSYYNTGRIEQQITGDLPASQAEWRNKTASYAYDALGQLTQETLVRKWNEETYIPPITIPGEQEPGYYMYNLHTDTLQDGHATYNALGWTTLYRDNVATGADNVHKAWTHDAVGNIRSAITTYRKMNNNGTLSAATQPQNYWYLYDSMNRMVTAKGSFTGTAGTGSIASGTSGVDITYNAAGERATSQEGSAAPETYTYNADGQLTKTKIGNIARAETVYDALGRVTYHVERNASNTLVHERKSITYDSARPNLVTSEKSKSKQGNDWIYAHTVNNYRSDFATGSPTITSANQQSTVTGSILTDSKTKYWKTTNANYTPFYSGGSEDTAYLDTDSDYYYRWIGAEGGSPLQSEVDLQNGNNYHNANKETDSLYSYDANGHLTDVRISLGENPRNVLYESDINGQILQRSEKLDGGGDAPHTRSYFFGGRQMGEVSNNGTSNIDYAQFIAERGIDVENPGAFRNGGSNAVLHADFDLAYDAINGAQEGSRGGGYVVRAGDSLQAIAAAVYGDSALWYKIAGSNGLTGAEPLTPGTNLTLPAGITRSTNNAASFKPYDPARAIGDVSPNTPLPPKAKDCGIAGQILLVAIAVAVSLALPGGGTVISAAFNAAVGTAASQGVGIITGIQKGFDLKGIAISALTAGIGKGLGSLSKVGGAIGKAGKFLNGTGIINKVAAAVTANALTQGIATVTGLQKKFSFTGVAAAGIGAAAGHVVGNALGSGTGVLGVKADAGSFGNKLASSAASAIANAATRSAIQGNSFGDNLIAAIPDVIGGAIGGAIGGSIKAADERAAARARIANTQHEAVHAQVANDPASNINHGVGANVASAIAQGGGALGGGGYSIGIDGQFRDRNGNVISVGGGVFAAAASGKSPLPDPVDLNLKETDTRQEREAKVKAAIARNNSLKDGRSKAEVRLLEEYNKAIRAYDLADNFVLPQATLSDIDDLAAAEQGDLIIVTGSKITTAFAGPGSALAPAAEAPGAAFFSNSGITSVAQKIAPRTGKNPLALGGLALGGAIGYAAGSIKTAFDDQFDDPFNTDGPPPEDRPTPVIVGSGDNDDEIDHGFSFTQEESLTFHNAKARGLSNNEAMREVSRAHRLGEKLITPADATLRASLTSTSAARCLFWAGRLMDLLAIPTVPIEAPAPVGGRHGIRASGYLAGARTVCSAQVINAPSGTTGFCWAFA